MNTEDLHSITTNWQINDDNVKADPAKLKEAYETTQSEIASFWNEVDGVKKSDLSVGDQLRKVYELLGRHIQNLPLISFETDGTFVQRGEGGTACGIIYSGTRKSLEYAFIHDFHDKIWLHYFDLVESPDDFWPLRDLCFPGIGNIWQSKEKTNEANGKIEEFLLDADAETLAGCLMQEENYSLSAEMPELYFAIMDRFIDTVDISSLAQILEETGKFSGITQEHFDRLLAKVQSADQESQDNLMPLMEELHGYYLS